MSLRRLSAVTVLSVLTLSAAPAFGQEGKKTYKVAIPEYGNGSAYLICEKNPRFADQLMMYSFRMDALKQDRAEYPAKLKEWEEKGVEIQKIEKEIIELRATRDAKYKPEVERLDAEIRDAEKAVKEKSGELVSLQSAKRHIHALYLESEKSARDLRKSTTADLCRDGDPLSSLESTSYWYGEPMTMQTAADRLKKSARPDVVDAHKKLVEVSAFGQNLREQFCTSRPTSVRGIRVDQNRDVLFGRVAVRQLMLRDLDSAMDASVSKLEGEVSFKKSVGIGLIQRRTTVVTEYYDRETGDETIRKIGELSDRLGGLKISRGYQPVDMSGEWNEPTFPEREICQLVEQPTVPSPSASEKTESQEGEITQ